MRFAPRSRAVTIGLAVVAAVALLGIGYLGGRVSPVGPSGSVEKDAASAATAPWTCPMHPVVQQAESGDCPICGMALVQREGAATQPAADGPAGAERWTCSMHPQIQLPRPGKCPICSMDLIPLQAPTGDGGPRTLTMSAEDRKLAQVVTAAVERRLVTAEVRMVGKVDFDETQVKTVSAWVPGRVDRLFIDYTGIPVKKGEHLALLYSPELLTAQQELIEARRWVDAQVPEPSAFLREAGVRTLDSAREKLRLLGLSDVQVREIEERGTAEDRVLITSTATGVVVQKHLQEGDYVKTGGRLYAIANLVQLWVKLDAYESDLPWLHYGQPVAIEAEALPGDVFEGIISFIDPVLDPRTRTVKVRVNVENREGKLKPEMFVRAVVSSQLASAGRVVASRLAGKWVSPMHPEIIRDRPGACPVCGMPLVRAEELGYVTAENGDLPPIVVPVTAVLRTGKRAVVYVEKPDADLPTYEGREIVLGPRAGDDYVVLEGLHAGERVVVHGNFKIDSALQIQAKPSMMSPEGGAPPPVHDHGGKGGGGAPSPGKDAIGHAGH
jgi:Cu(I)/Ag(I) efflux system membrane fusion protein